MTEKGRKQIGVASCSAGRMTNVWRSLVQMIIFAPEISDKRTIQFIKT